MSMRVPVVLNAHLLAGASSYRTAGIHAYIYNTLIRLPNAAPDFDFNIMLGQGELPAQEGWHIHRSKLPTRSPVIRVLWEQAILPSSLSRLEAELLHGMAFSLPVLWPGRSVVTVFDLSFMRYPDRIGFARRSYLSLFTGISARRARRVIAISQSGKQEIQGLLGIAESRIDVAPPGVSEAFRPLPRHRVEEFRREQALPDRFILYVGTLEPRKNLETLVVAYAKSALRPRLKLVLAGARGWRTDSLFQLIESLGLKQDVILPGYVPADALPLWYNAAEVFAYPSLYEGFGIPVAEAMACGIPVLAANTSSLPEIVGPDGILLDPTSVEAWADALSSTVENAALRRIISEQGVRRAARFKWDDTVASIIASYRRALEN